MINRYIIPLILVFFLSCKTQCDSEEVANAKWYYFAYAIEQNGYSSDGNGVDPLECNIKVNSIKHISADTTKFYFTLYQKDTLDICYLKPLGLVGVLSVKNRLYIPIYHSVIFDNEADSLIIKKMKKQSTLLLQKLLRNNKHVNSWLQTEAKRREAN